MRKRTSPLSTLARLFLAQVLEALYLVANKGYFVAQSLPLHGVSAYFPLHPQECSYELQQDLVLSWISQGAFPHTSDRFSRLGVSPSVKLRLFIQLHQVVVEMGNLLPLDSSKKQQIEGKFCFLFTCVSSCMEASLLAACRIQM